MASSSRRIIVVAVAVAVVVVVFAVRLSSSCRGENSSDDDIDDEDVDWAYDDVRRCAIDDEEPEPEAWARGGRRGGGRPG